MKNVRPTMFIMLFAAVPVAASAQVPEATDILASEIETVRQTLGPSIDHQSRSPTSATGMWPSASCTVELSRTPAWRT